MKSVEYEKKYLAAKEYYINHQESITKVSQMYQIDRGIFAKNLKQDGITVINRQNIPKLNQFYFDAIDNEHKAYWLGFFYADGYVGSEQNSIEVSLKSSDIGHLEKLALDLSFQDKKLFQDDIRCRLSFHNKHMRESLIEQGCVPRKSLILTFPSSEQVPDELIRHFVRGYIDGDGSLMIGINHRGERVIPRLNILGTKSFLTTMVKKMGWKENKIQHPSNVYSIEWGGHYVLNYLKQLYEDCSIYLDRKYKIFLQLKAFADNKSQD